MFWVFFIRQYLVVKPCDIHPQQKLPRDKNDIVMTMSDVTNFPPPIKMIPSEGVDIFSLSNVSVSPVVN